MPFPLSRFSLHYLAGCVWLYSFSETISLYARDILLRTDFKDIVQNKGQCFLLFKRIINLYVLPLMRIKLSKMITRMHKIYLLQPVQNKVVCET
jgi:hypothetical protein